ncbi:MAG: NAD(P)H-dependent oxidoreductase [Kordiimonadaceae bacterium]|nr:NAD(P)H-dependent oxidoreductase [Kordiimonadaceae bacterium]MBO6569068.1 NAD(P)H-dependent oxidoreductase [Kordiimonadaceae bacterium]MBO6964543.1 NAD(P)H-dependent oxidoreductase [Kordiimonadaceae bacterium]
MSTPANTILRIDSSARKSGSTTRELTSELVSLLSDQLGGADIIARDVADGLPFVDEDWVNANFTAPEDRTDAHKQKLAFSDSLVAELQNADTIVIGLPIYNFGVPATLKAWVDMIARARLTFRYTSEGPEGLLTGKKAYIAVASGGTSAGSEIDFATSYLRHALKFVGITDVTLIDASAAAQGAEEALNRAKSQISAVGA